MRLLDRHIFKQVALTCFGAVAFFTFILTTANAIKDLLAHVFSGRIGMGDAVQLIAWLIPYSASYALPMGILCGVLLVLGRMSAESEITAMRAAGLSLRRISAPIYALAILGVFAGLAVNFYYMPLARTKYRQTFAQILRSDPMAVLVPRTFVRDFPGKVIYADSREGAVLKNVWFWELDKQQRVVRFSRAESGRLDLDNDTNELVVTPTKASTESRNTADPESFVESLQIGTVGSGGLRFSLDGVFGHTTTNRKADWLTYDELRGEITKLEAAVAADGAKDKELVKKLTRFRMTFQEKWATAFAVLAFALVAVPLGIKVSRRETSANLGVAVALALTYYFLSVVVKWMDGQAALRPDLLMWLPNIIFVIVAFSLMRRVERA